MTFGVIGGCGASGRAVACELLRSEAGAVLLGGRDRGRLEAVAAELGGRVSIAPVDVLDAKSLDEFCSRSPVIINCAGPVMLLGDRVAQAAFRARCHYIDPAGMSVVKEGLALHEAAIEEAERSFVISCGWTPGLSELVPAYAHARASTKMDSIDSVEVYLTDSGEWSENAVRDAVFYLRRTGFPKPGYFRKGVRVPVKLSQATRKADLGIGIGCRQFSLVSLAELDELGRRLGDCEFSTYSYLSGIRTTAAALAIGVLPLPESVSIRWMRGIFRRNRLAVAGFIVARVAGKRAGRGGVLQCAIVFDAGRDYWIHAQMLATVARLVAAGKSATGVHFLTEALHPLALMAELEGAGVEHSEHVEFA